MSDTLRINITLANLDRDAGQTFAIARLDEPGMCPVLGPDLLRRVRGLIGGLPALLVYEQAGEDRRWFGRDDLVRLAVPLNLEDHTWATFVLSVDEEGSGSEA